MQQDILKPVSDYPFFDWQLTSSSINEPATMIQPFSDKLWLFFQCRFCFLPLQLPLNSLNLRVLSCWPSAHRTNRLWSRLYYLHVNSPPASEDSDEMLPLDGSMTLKKGGKDDIVASAGVFV